MVMSMDTYADQTMSSPPLPSNEDSASPSAIMSSPSPFQQQESADDEHEDEHSKGSNQTVVARHRERHSAQLRDDNDSTTPIVDERVDTTGTNDHQEKMIVSRGSSFDGDKRLAMNIDEESNEESSMRANLKFDPLELELELKAKLAQQAKTSGMPVESKVESSLVAQMRDIVEGGSSRMVSVQKQHVDELGQPKSSSDSLNNQNDNNTSKASLDSATGHKRTRHSRVHQCRHHHNHHHHRHRQSIGGTSITGSQIDGGVAASNNTGANPSHSHYQHHHHHRHSNTGHTHPHHHHHHHHHHSGHHHHHHHHHQDKNKGTSSKRNSIQRLHLIESVSSQHQPGKNESNSSVSTVSITKQGQQSNQPDQSQPESGKSSGSPSDEQTIDPENQESSQRQQANRDGHHHHHSHHHHCHHRSHKKRLVLDAGNNQPEAVAKSEDSSSRKKPLQDSTSGMNVEPRKYHHHAHHQPHEHSHHHHHHHHAHHHHNHPHNHHHHAHSIHCADDQASSNKDLSTDPSQQQALADGSHQHHQHQRHHKHHHNHHHNHHCRHNRHRNRARSGSKANNSLRDSGKTLDTVGADQAAERRFSSHSVAGVKRGDNDDQSSIQDENEPLVVSTKNDDVVNMEVSPKSDRKGSQVILNDHRARLISDMDSVGPALGANGSSNVEGDALKDSEIGACGDGNDGGDASRKHDSSCNFDQTIQADQENVNSRGGVGGNEEEGHNRLSRQISSQSSKKSQKDGLHGVGQNQQDQRHNECAEPILQVAGANQQSSRPKQVIESSGTVDRRCRLCWCCCCPCSALNVREAPDRSVDKSKSTSGPPSSPTSKYPTPPNVPLDEIRSWGDSFDKLMKCTDGRKVFQDFLRCEYSEENILFWSACEELKKERDSKSIAARARDIYEDYISILSSKEVSLDSRVRDVINSNIKKPTSNIFDEAQLQIYTLMHRDSYPRFINSGMYKKLAQITTSNSRKSSS